MLTLVKPSRKYEHQFIEMIEEWKLSKKELIPCSIEIADYNNFREMILNLKNKSKGFNLKADEVPYTTYWIYDNKLDKIIGIVTIRHKLNDILSRTKGHIDIDILPSEIQNNYEKSIFKLTLEECKKLKIDKPLVICNKNNDTFSKTIKNNGGILESEITEENTVLQIYRINSKNNKLSKLSTILLYFIICSLLGIFTYSSYKLYDWWKNTNSTSELYDNVISEVTNTSNSNDSTKETNSINFNKLKEINSDIVAWIEIPNTNINYPIVQGNDNDYYLKRNIEKKYDSSGSIFLDYRNSDDFANKNTIIFGHNMHYKTMFSDLVNIYNKKLGNDIQIKITLPNEIRTYQVFSVYMTEPEAFGIDPYITANNFIEFTKTLEKRNILDNEPMSISKNDSIITLSTCDYSNTKRIIVHAVLKPQ